MAPEPSTPGRSASARRRGRPPGNGTSARPARNNVAESEPPLKKRKYVPGGPGGGGRFIEADGKVTFADTPTSATSSRPRPSAQTADLAASSPLVSRRERSTRTRTAVTRYEPTEERYGSAAAVAAAVVQSEGYKPREERGWEEFHPDLDIEKTFMIFHSEDVDGIAKSTPPTPAAQSRFLPLNGASTPGKNGSNAIPNLGEATTAGENPPAPGTPGSLPGTPLRRTGRTDPRSYFATAGTPKTPQVLPIHNQSAKEKLELKQPAFRKTDRIALFESSKSGLARYVDKAMSNVGYQESDQYIRPGRLLIKATDGNLEEETEIAGATRADGEGVQHTSAGNPGRVEYDMDEQDDMWLEKHNAVRAKDENNPVTREVFEITITKIEKEWHNLEKRIPKPNPKPPQTHRPRSSSAAAVNGETQPGEEQDSKCAICDDGDCENTNAIVFCDGCDLAVHQECYGVPFIPEGQWLCRKCQLIGRGVPTCLFCPNTDGAFKQANSSRWAHLLCAMWIPEVSLGNHTFMEPVMDVDKVPKSRWKLSCYICNQQMGACIQCSNKSCYQAFHVTCARRSRLQLKMKNSQGALAVDGSMPLMAYCDKHCQEDYAEEHQVAQAFKDAKRFYRRTMKYRIWADSQASVLRIQANNQQAITEHPPDQSQMTGAKLDAVIGDKKKGQPAKPMWKLPSGAPIIPQSVLDIVESSLQRFNIRKRKEFVQEACRYWTLKREARRGAALLKRLQLQMETFSSMELTRRNFAAMGPSGQVRLQRRIEFGEMLLADVLRIQAINDEVVKREKDKLEQAEMEAQFVDMCYFPLHKLLLPVIEKAIQFDKHVFLDGLLGLQAKMEQRYYITTLPFVHDLCEVINVGINSAAASSQASQETVDISPTKHSTYTEARDKKRLGKRMLKAVQPQLENALRAEADITHKALPDLIKEMEGMIEASLEVRRAPAVVPRAETPAPAEPAAQDEDVAMVDGAEEGDGEGEASIVVADEYRANLEGEDRMEVDEPVEGENIEVNVSTLDGNAKTNGVLSSNVSVIGAEKEGAEDKSRMADGNKPSDTPPADNDYVALPHSVQPSPLTPPQSNGSLGRGPANTLTDGGLPWYLKGFNIEGTSAVEEQWAGRDAVRSLSEDLTDMDDEELNGLEFDVEDSTITASAEDPQTGQPHSSTLQKRGKNGKFRKGVRSSARKR